MNTNDYEKPAGGLQQRPPIDDAAAEFHRQALLARDPAVEYSVRIDIEKILIRVRRMIRTGFFGQP